MSQRTEELDQVDVRILRGFARGALSKTVATELDLPLRTVERRMSSIRERLGAPNTVAAVVIAVRRGYI
ncbi:LuxR C-terminal-related transcriptional regulator [Nocardioides nitrophenolicus]|uniref:LuxR C-terminal-related transcriptional regulator n=1 Tax=Nocardioides nitrophenolicus TaxID=60489 RepID=UPI00195E75F8|nr:LuxR C-terminal-related transcriptional regulator [Nocardioides nitrophenolicus]MBM7519372.1 DNA-binding NarL/FixJ family response regulator [Nocardioides nitrophenolicus]